MPTPARIAALLLTTALACTTPPPRTPSRALTYDVVEKSLATLAADLAANRVTSEQLVAIYSARIRSLDQSGPELHSIIALNPRAQQSARALDIERAQGHVRSALHGIPILVKDNIETIDPLPTTAGSLALTENFAQRDATIIERLRAAGAVILGKTNLSEWANIRSTTSTSGWSAVGGLTKNPYATGRNPCGSSSGSGTAITANLAAAAIGTETDGSITCPASVLGLVGVKPTVGLVSRSGIVPISAMQDTAGPMTRTVADAAALLEVLAAPDARDPSTHDAAEHGNDFTRALEPNAPNALAGKRFGILKFQTGYLASVDALFDAAVAELKNAGAEIEIVESLADHDAIEEQELTVLLRDFRKEVDAYLAATPPSVKTRSLAALIAWNREHASSEMPYFEQELFERAEATAKDDPVEVERTRRDNQKRAAEALDQALRARALDALIAPTLNPAWMTDLVNGDHFLGGASLPPAIAGYPHVTVPMGQVSGLPVGLSFVGTAWSDARLLQFAAAYEQRTHLRRPPPLEQP